MELNDERLRIIDSDGHLLIMGGPGSGKTTIALIKANNDCPKLQQYQNILFLSFARATVTRVMEHCAGLINESRRDSIKISTYHAFEWEIIKTNSKLLTPFPISILLPHDASALFPNIDEKDRMAILNEHFNETGQMHFDLFAHKTVELLSNCDCLLKIICDAYPIIIFDEFQDTNQVEWELVKLLGKYSTLIALADPEQRIYDFRGASPARIQEYISMFEPAIFDFGTENNRSSDTDIVEFGNDLMLGTNKTKSYQDVEIRKYAFSTVPHIRLKTMILDEYMKIKKIHPELTLAILTPSNNLMLEVSDCLYSEQVFTSGKRLPSIDHDVFVDTAGPSLAAEIIAFILDYGSQKCISIVEFVTMLRKFILGHKQKTAKKDSELADALSRYIETGRMIGKNRKNLLFECENIVKAANEYLYSGEIYDDWKYIVNLFSNSKNEYILKISQQARYIKLLRKGSVFYSSLDEIWKNNANYSGASRVIEDALTQEHFSLSNQHTKDISVMTIHKSKGKEFDIVIVYEGTFAGRIYNPDKSDKNKSLLNLRVAVTRAKCRTIILTPAQDPCSLIC